MQTQNKRGSVTVKKSQALVVRGLAPDRCAAIRVLVCATVCLVLILVVGCTDQGASYQGVFLGEFTFTAVDTIGITYRTGIIGLYKNNLRITGFWKSGEYSGNLEGVLRREEIRIELNPQFQDNDFFMVGTIVGNTFSGRWQHYGIGGLMAQGTFAGSRL